ncbi:MAG: hypothetical protein HND46_15180 [Chloroflexi bacterium]|nr:hypothetical protein [Chloroflexota bacterium]
MSSSAYLQKPSPTLMNAHAAAVMLQSFLDALRDSGIDWPEQVIAIAE